MFTLRFDMRAKDGPGSAPDLYAAAIEMAAWGEQHGAAAVVVCEHHASPDGYLPTPLLLASALAARTTRIPIQVAALLVPLALLERPWQSFASASWVAYVVIAYSALLGTPAHIAFYQGVRTVGPGRASVFMNLMPFLVLGLSWLLLGQAIRWYHLIGAIGVIAGVILTTRR